MRISDWSSDVCSSDLLPWTTFGEVRDHVVAHVAAYSGGGTTCATQMTFYRLRRALGLGRHVGPAAPLAPLIGGKLRQAFSALEADTDLQMPATRAGWLGIVSGLCFAVAVPILAFPPPAPPLRIFAAGASAYAGPWSIGRAACRDRVCQYVWISVVAAA